MPRLGKHGSRHFVSVASARCQPTSRVSYSKARIISSLIFLRRLSRSLALTLSGGVVPTRVAVITPDSLISSSQYNP